MQLGIGLSMTHRLRGVASLPAQVRAILAKYGSDAHLYLPGAGVKSGWTCGNFTDSAGTTPGYTDAPVGLVLDAQGSLGPNLLANNEWMFPASWAESDGGEFICSGNTDDALYTIIPSLVQGRVYSVSFTVSGRTSGSVRVSLGSAYQHEYAWISENGTYTQLRVCAGPYDYRFVFYTGSNFVGSVTPISVREVTGIHATQNTAASKPTNRRGLVNELLYSHALDNSSYWSAYGAATITGGQTDPFGGTGAYKVSMPSSLTGWHHASQVTSIVGTTYTQFMWMRSEVSGEIRALNGTNADYNATLNLTTDWQLFAVSGVATSINNQATPVYRDNAGQLSVVYVYGVGLAKGTHTAEEILALGGIPLTTTAPASTATGPDYWAFDGNDSLGSTFAAGTLPADADVFMCVRRDSASAFVAAYAAYQGNPYIGVVASGDSTTAMHVATGSAYSVLVDGVQIGSTGSVTRDQFHTALSVGAFHTLEMRNLNLSTWAGFFFGLYESSYAITGAICPVLITSALSDADRTTVRKWMAKESGVTL